MCVDFAARAGIAMANTIAAITKAMVSTISKRLNLRSFPLW